MARYSKTLTPAAQAAFVAALRSGALVVAAAGAAGVAVSTLYCRRHRDAAFAEAWDEAVEWSTSAVLLRPADLRSSAARQARGAARPGRGLRLGRTRRTRFSAWRREVFLAYLQRTCHSRDSADAAGVHVSTVHRAIARDPAFARAVKAALARGYARLDGMATRQREAAAARLRGWEIGEVAEPVSIRGIDPDKAIRLLRRWERPDGSIGPRRVRHGRQKSWSFDRAIEAVDRQLRWLGIPIPGGEEEAGP